MIEFRLLNQFVVVAEELNFGRAAQRLHISQPPLSVAIRNLETLVGAMLIDRSRHHVRLTPAGKVFLKDCRRMLRHVKLAAERARRAASGEEGLLRLSFVPSAAIELLPDMLKRFQRRCPAVQLKVTAQATRRQLDDLRRSTVDLALVVGPLDDQPDLDSLPLAPQALVLAVPLGHALASRGTAPVEALAGEDFIAFPAAEGAGFAASFHALCRAAGFEPRVIQEVSQMQAVLTLVAGGLGIALVPASMRMLAMDDVAFVALEAPAPTYPLAFAWSRANDNPVVQSFLAEAMPPQP